MAFLIHLQTFLIVMLSEWVFDVKYWTLTNGCIIRSNDCQSSNLRDMGLPL